jgi:cytochrome o ubiquinol oxidase subunit 3
LLSDIIIFSALFAAYAVLNGETDGGPSPAELFDKRHVIVETGCLLASSFTCGMMMIATERRQGGLTYLWALVTAALGLAFLRLEISEFIGMAQQGAGPTRSAFLSSFFTLVGTHGAHVTVGIVWLMLMMAQIRTLGFRPMVLRRMLCFSLFWHALDIVWIGVFTVVYLGAHA